MTLPAPPPHLREALEYVFGAAGSDWLDQLPRLLATLVDQWDLELDHALSEGQMSYCASGVERSSGSAIVLKASPSPATATREIDALEYWAGRGTPRVLHSDPARGAFAMQRILPGTPWRRHNEPKDEQVLTLLRELHRAPAEPPRSALTFRENVNLRASWADERFADPSCRQQRRDLELARAAFAYLHATALRIVLLHGDFQGKNVLHGTDGLVTIDPLPTIGDPQFDQVFWCVKHHEPWGIAKRVGSLNRGHATDRQRLMLWAWSIAALERRDYDEHISEIVGFLDTYRDLVVAEVP